jgi:CPA1 family monovalent cation:H+ antiporter
VIDVTHVLEFVLAAVAVLIVIELIAERTGLPAAALLTIGGLIYAALPGPNISLDPDVILTFVLPPLLYSAALNSSLIAIRQNIRAVISLSVALVLATAFLVGVVVHLAVPAVSLAAGIAMGAAVAPPDPVAALAIGRRVGLPPNQITQIEGEGLLNDATALTTFTVAVLAERSGGFSIPVAAGRFFLAAAGGLVTGIVVALLVRLIHTRVTQPLLVNTISLVTPYGAYLLGEELHLSGVLAVVVAGLIIGHNTSRGTSGASRLQAGAVWRQIDFVLEGFVFLLIGQQLIEIVRGLDAFSVATIVTAGAVTVGIVLGLRPLWLLVTQWLPPRLHMRLGGERPRDERPLSGKEVFVLSWAGTRGVISLAAIFTLPVLTDSGQPFSARDLLQFCTFLVVVVTLVGQGMTFAPIVRAVGLRADAADEARLRNEARAASVSAALLRLDELAAEDDLDEDMVEALRANLEQRKERYRRRINLLDAAEDGSVPVSPRYEAAVRARRSVIDAQREELLRWRDAGRLPDASLRILERELDHEERTLPDRPPR